MFKKNFIRKKTPNLKLNINLTNFVIIIAENNLKEKLINNINKKPSFIKIIEKMKKNNLFEYKIIKNNITIILPSKISLKKFGGNYYLCYKNQKASRHLIPKENEIINYIFPIAKVHNKKFINKIIKLNKNLEDRKDILIIFNNKIYKKENTKFIIVSEENIINLNKLKQKMKE